MARRSRVKRKGTARKKPPAHQAWQSSFVKPSGLKMQTQEHIALRNALKHPHLETVFIEGRCHLVDPATKDEKIAQLRSEYGYEVEKKKK